MTPKDLRSRRMAMTATVPQLAAELGLTGAELQQMEEGQIPLPPHEWLASALDRIEVKAREERLRDCLVVEDDEGVRQLFVSRLRREGLTVDEAATGVAALDATAMRDYRLLLLDLKLPGPSGAEVLDRVCRKPTPPANVIIISASDTGDVMGMAANRNVNAILRKSFAIANADLIFPALAALARG